MVVAFGRLIKKPVLDAVPMINMHFSLLPRWRGAAPVERAILAGDLTTGVGIMQLEEGLDTGPIYARARGADPRRTRRPPSCAPGSPSWAPTCCSTLLRRRLRRAGPAGAEAAGGRARRTRTKLVPEELRLDWSQPPEQLERVVRVGGAWTTFRGKRLKVHRAQRARRRARAAGRAARGQGPHARIRLGPRRPVAAGRSARVVTRRRPAGSRSMRCSASTSTTPTRTSWSRRCSTPVASTSATARSSPSWSTAPRACGGHVTGPPTASSRTRSGSSPSCATCCASAATSSCSSARRRTRPWPRAVDLAPERARGLVNAVLRKVAAEPVRWPDPPTRLSYPDWVVARLATDLGRRRALGALRADERGARGRRAAPTATCRTGRRSGWRPTSTPDRASGSPTCARRPAARRRCMAASRCVGGRGRRPPPAAPGWSRRNAARLGATACRTLIADGRRPPHRAGTFDRVLVDAPCSGLGVLRRRPDARWHVQPDDVDDPRRPPTRAAHRGRRSGARRGARSSTRSAR